MGASVSLSTSTVTVEAGAAVAVLLQVVNTGTVVDQFNVTVLGEAAVWSTVEPASLSLFPGDTGTITVHFQPPRHSAVPAASYPFGLRILSREDPQHSSVEEGTITVLPFLERTAELLPRTARGSHRATYELAIDNLGNSRMNADIVGLDPNGELGFRFDPPSAVVLPGKAAFVKTTVTAQRPFWKGLPRTRPFKIHIGAKDQSIPTTQLDGVMLHEPRLPRWFFKALALTAAALVALVALWFALLKPTIHNEATTAAKQLTAPLNRQVAAAQKSANAANQTADAAAAKIGAPITSSTTTTVPGPLTTPTGARLTMDIPPGQTSSENLPGIPSGKPFEMTDVVFENVNGDSGTVSILEGGQGGTVVLRENLANFRSLDYHFVSPVPFPKGTSVTLEATCNNPAANGDCSPAAYIGGYVG
jgi:hypothetical protein